jgi:hypothetical protein
MPLFTVIALWAAYEVVAARRARWAVVFFVALAAQVQVRILALIFGPAALLTVLIWPMRWGIRWPALGIALGALLTVPYLSWVGLHWGEISAKLAEGNRGVAFDSHHGAAELVLWVGAGFGLLPASSDVAAWLAPLGMAGQGALVLVGLLLAAGCAMAVLGAVRRAPGWERPLLPVLWLLLPVVALVGQSSSVYLHYLVALFPAIFLVIALPVGWLLDRPRLPLMALGGVILALLTAYQLTATAALYRVMEAWELEEPPSAPPALRFAAVGIPREASELLGTGERYGVEPPIRYWQAIADRAIAEANAAGAGDVLLISGDTDPLIAEVPAVLDYLLRPRVTPRFLPADTLIFEMLKSAVIVELPGVDPIESMDRFGERRGTVSSPSMNTREGLARARITYIPGRGPQGWQALVPNRLTARYEGQVQLLGYRAERQVKAGDDLPVTTFWWLTSRSEARPVVSLRMVNANGQIVRSEQADRALPVIGEGDWMVARQDVFSVPQRTPPGQYTLEAALVDDETGRAIRATEPAGASVPLGTVRVNAR